MRSFYRLMCLSLFMSFLIAGTVFPWKNSEQNASIVYVVSDSRITEGSPWKTVFTEPNGKPIVDIASYAGSLYVAAGDDLYIFNNGDWSTVNAPSYITSLESYANELIIGGQGGLYSFNGTDFNAILTVQSFVRVLGVCNDKLYAGTILDRYPTLYYCDGFPDNPSDWHVDLDFRNLLNFTGPFASIDSLTAHSGRLYVGSGGTLYSFNETCWKVENNWPDVYAFADMQVFNGRIYLATRDQHSRKPMYLGGSGFSGRVIESDGENWTTILDLDCWIFALEVYDKTLYAGTAGRILTYDGTVWKTELDIAEGAFYSIALTNYNNSIYVGMGNGYIFSQTREIVANFVPADSDLTSPSGIYRWLDSADQTYRASYRDSYNYSQATATVTYSAIGKTLVGKFVAQNLKPNFAYQLKLVGEPGIDGNEQIGLTGRWWQEEWNGLSWANGQNLNNKGTGSSPNPNDLVYFSRRSVEDPGSPSGYHYRYTGYLLFAYFITDESGHASIDFETGNSYHVVWKTSQRSRTSNDGPLQTVTFDPDPSQPAYDTDLPESTISIFGEWERLPANEVDLPDGQYICQMVLTEESFHGTTPLAGNWAAALRAEASFTISA